MNKLLILLLSEQKENIMYVVITVSFSLLKKANVKVLFF